MFRFRYRANLRTARMYPACVCGASLRIRMSSIMRCRRGETVLGSELMTVLRSRDEADCPLNLRNKAEKLTSRHPPDRGHPYRASGLVLWPVRSLTKIQSSRRIVIVIRCRGFSVVLPVSRPYISKEKGGRTHWYSQPTSKRSGIK
jgi:hypothetical protein